jgi:hypothetical protein
VGDAGWTWGVWSTSIVACQLAAPMRSPEVPNSLLGVVRLPKKRIIGWRPCWRILVAIIAMV